jgi:hypothetical protein
MIDRNDFLDIARGMMRWLGGRVLSGRRDVMRNRRWISRSLLLVCVRFALPVLAAEEAAVPQAVRALASVSRPPGKVESGTYSWSTGNYRCGPAGNVMAIGDQSFRYDLNSRLTIVRYRAVASNATCVAGSDPEKSQPMGRDELRMPAPQRKQKLP